MNTGSSSRTGHYRARGPSLAALRAAAESDPLESWREPFYACRPQAVASRCISDPNALRLPPRYFVPLPRRTRSRWPSTLVVPAVTCGGLDCATSRCSAGEAALDDLRLVHTEGYLQQLADGTLDARRCARSAYRGRRRCGAVRDLPPKERFSRRARRSRRPCRQPRRRHPPCLYGHGEGFCVLNDVAVATRVLQRDGLVRRALVVDLDVHQGNARPIFEATPTCSRSRCTASATTDAQNALDARCGTGRRDRRRRLPGTRCAGTSTTSWPASCRHRVLSGGRGSGAGDRYGRLALSDEGLRQRERCVLEACVSRGLKVVITIAGGYARRRSARGTALDRVRGSGQASSATPACAAS